jgi:tungstate transport system ATP-binding protein
MEQSLLLSVENLVVKRGKVIVLNVNELKVFSGRTLALIGPNGAGKSTLLLTLAGLLPIENGRLYFQSQMIKGRSALAMLRRSVAVVFQEPLLLNMNVEKNVAVGLKFRHLSVTETKKSVDEALAYFGIEHLAKRSAKTLSGGESKRVSLARAFAIKPKVILLDEAFNSLDPPTREAIIDDLQNILQKTRITAVLALHDREETLRLAQDVAAMGEGKIIQQGTTAQVFQQPVNEYIANFVGTETILEGRVMSCTTGNMVIDVNGRKIEAVGDCSVGQQVFCCLRPEIVTVSKYTQEKSSARNIFEAKVSKITRQGLLYKIFLECGFPLVAYITIPSYEELEITQGAIVYASFKSTAVHVIPRDQKTDF